MIKLAVSTALVVLLAGPAVYALQEPDKEKPAQQEDKKQEPERKPEEKQPQEKPQQEKQTKEQNERTKQTDKERQDTAKQQAAAKQQQAPRENPAANNNARRIKEEDFRAHFGRQHEFRVARRDDRRFNYGGYWFTYSDPWPPAWSYSDEVYVDEIDGQYYLVDPVHPGLRLLVIVSS